MAEQMSIECEPYLERATEPLDEVSPKIAVEGLLGERVEACSEYCGSVVATNYHAFIAAIHRAFVDHRPIVLSPDMLWLLIAQGFANHVNANAEQMREHFVTHKGKKSLVVRCDDLLKGSLENPWSKVFDQFSLHIKQEIGDTNHSNIIGTFSTTGPIEKAACEVVLMDSMKPYFEYCVSTLCGIPEVQLEGNKNDWRQLTDKTRELGNVYDLSWWTDRMLPRLEMIADQSKGNGDPSFWRNIYKWNGGNGSGAPHFNGWIVDFIPYVIDGDSLTRNWLFPFNNLFENPGLTTDCLPSSLCRVPFTWECLGNTYQMQFIAGFMCFSQDLESLAIRPKIGWAVRDLADTDSRITR